MAFAKDFTFADSELLGICTELMGKFSNLNNKKKVHMSVELTGLLKVLFFGARFDKLHENYKLNMFYFLKQLFTFTDVWSLQNGVNFKDKLALSLALRIMCFNPDTELISMPELKGKQMYFFVCNLLQRQLGFQAEAFKNIVFQGIAGCGVQSGIPKRTILYLPSTSNYQEKWKVDQAAEISKVMSQWFLLHCNQSMPSPSSKKQGLFQKKNMKEPLTTEVDGTTSRGIFTVLNIMSNYHDNWIMNIYAFSVLKQWILFLQSSETIIDCLTNIPISITPTKDFRVGSGSVDLRMSPCSPSLSDNSRFYDTEDSDSVDTQSIASSFMSATESVFADDLYENLASSRTSSPQPDDTRSQLLFYRGSTRSPDTLSIASDVSRCSSSNLKYITIKYCLRVLGQSERVPRRISDRSVVTAAVVESMQILDTLCDNGTSISQKAFVEVKRLHTRIESKPVTTRRVYVELIQFCIHHHESMIVQIDDVMEVYFREIPAKLYHNQVVAFEMLNLCLKNKEFFQTKSKILSLYFPNVFKLLAWWPFSFLSEACEIIEVFACEDNFLETFHSILDLPTLSALLYLKHSKMLNDNELLEKKLGTPIKPYFNAMFSYFLREKSGGGETIDKLSELHTGLEMLGSNPRITYTSDIVPAMLVSFFNVLESSNHTKVIRNMFPVILERAFQLYPPSDVIMEILEIFAENLQIIAKLSPDVIRHYQEEINTFFNQIQLSTNRIVPVLCSLIWCIGEYACSEENCSRQQVTEYYETLETMLYEASSVVGSSSTNILVCPKVITSLVSALSKLAAYSQELIPRAVVSLTKICSTRKTGKMQASLSLANALAVTTFTLEMINLLQKPKVAPAILCRNGKKEPWHLQTESSLTMKVRLLAEHAATNLR